MNSSCTIRKFCVSIVTRQPINFQIKYSLHHHDCFLINRSCARLLSSKNDPSQFEQNTGHANDANAPQPDILKQSQNATLSTPLVVYQGVFGGKLQMLRRFSLGTTFMTTFGVPMFLNWYADHLTVVGQAGISGILLFMSCSSTILLQLLTSPYVTQLTELPSVSDSSSTSRKFEALRINLYGNLVPTTFNLEETEKVRPSQHPFATFRNKVDGKMYYIYGENMKDPELLRKLAN